MSPAGTTGTYPNISKHLTKGLLSMEGVPVARTNAFSLGNNPLPFSHPLLSVIPSVPGFPTSPPPPTTTDVVLLKENHTHPTEAATLDRKSGEAEGSAVRHSGAPHLSFYNHFPLCHPERDRGSLRFLSCRR